jgi:hypothetical protein
MFCAPVPIFDGTMGVRSRFHVLRSRTHFRRTMGVRSRFHVLRSRTHFRRYLGRQVRFLFFALPDSFSAVRKASGLVIMLSWFALLDSFSTVRMASGPVIMFCAPGLIFSGTDGVGSRYHVLRSRTHFQRYRGRCVPVPFSWIVLPDSFSAVPRVSGPVLLFCAVGPFFGGTDGVGSYILVLRSWTRFRRDRGRRLAFSCIALPYSFSAVPTASSPVFMFCALRPIFGGSMGVRCRFHVLRSMTRFRRY